MISRRAMKRLLAAGLFCAPAILHAQAAEPPRPRTGPDAAPQVVPPYAEPQTLPLGPTQAPAAPAVSGMVTLADVNVIAEPAEASAAPLPGWQPGSDAASGLTLSIKPEEQFDAAWVKRMFADNGLIGQPVPLDRLVSLVQLINVALVRNGYVNSGLLVSRQVPPEGGTLDLRLIFGRIVAPAEGQPGVIVEYGPGGSKGITGEFVRRRLPSADDVPVSAIALERDFRLLAENPAIRTVNIDLRPGARPGEAALAVIVDPQDRFDVYGSIANSRSPSIGGERIAFGGSMRNLLAGGDIISGEYGFTSGREDFLVGYETPLAFISPRTSLLLRGGENKAAVVDAPLRPLGIESEDWSIEGGISHKLLETPLTPASAAGPGAPARSFAIGLRGTHRVSRSFLLGEPFSFSPGSVRGRAEYTALRFTADWVERGVRQVVAISFTGTVGLDGTRSDVPGLASPDENFKVVLGQLSFARRLNSKGLEIRARVAGQYADGILYSGERFSVGGENSVRGYRENLLLADTGVFGSIELAQPFSLTGGRRDQRGFDWGAFQASVFVDGATVNNKEGQDPLPKSVGSVGVSLAWVPSDAIFARITYGEALRDVVPGGSRDLQDRGVQFRVTIRPLQF